MYAPVFAPILPMSHFFSFKTGTHSGYSPELNPAEGIFEEIRRQIEGIVYPSLSAKHYRIDHFLRRLRASQIHQPLLTHGLLRRRMLLFL